MWSTVTVGDSDHRRNFVCDGGDYHHHSWKWRWLSSPLFQREICNFCLILWSLGKRIVFFLLPEAFSGLKHAENAIAADRRLWRVDARAFGASVVVPPDTKSWRRHWSPPLFKVKLRLCHWHCLVSITSRSLLCDIGYRPALHHVLIGPIGLLTDK